MKKLLISTFLLVLGISNVYADACSTINGRWEFSYQGEMDDNYDPPSGEAKIKTISPGQIRVDLSRGGPLQGTCYNGFVSLGGRGLPHSIVGYFKNNNLIWMCDGNARPRSRNACTSEGVGSFTR